MSFRLRVLALVVLVAFSATAATAWLTLRQASEQITESATADRQQVEEISAELRRYGYRHGTWEGVDQVVRELWRRTGQRIHLVTEAGTVVADSDTLNGRTARPTDSSATLVDPRPTPVLPDDRATAAKALVVEIAAYRRSVLIAACLTRGGVETSVVEDPYGIPAVAAPAADDAAIETECREAAREPDRDPVVDVEAAAVCRVVPLETPAPRATATAATADPALASYQDCLQRVFRRQVEDLAPVPLRVYLGARGEAPSPLATGPALAAAAAVAVLAVLGTALISRRVLRPIGTLITASGQLGRGDLTGRVPVVGDDELAELARSFNRMADSLQRGEERQRRLIADVAHELRTPLANLRGYLEALADGVITPDPELFASLHEEAVLQQRIVDDLQDLALAEAGTLAYHRGPVDLAELLETCRAAHHAVAEAAGVRLAVDAAGPVPVEADSDRLRQVIGNLITNALRATAEDGTVVLRVGVLGPRAVVEVADTGTGIAADALPHVFDRFWRADSARGRRTGGSGLGLAIARQIVTDHGGTIGVHSREGEGTTFTITLPLSATGTPVVSAPTPARRAAR